MAARCERCPERKANPYNSTRSRLANYSRYSRTLCNSANKISFPSREACRGRGQSIPCSRVANAVKSPRQRRKNTMTLSTDRPGTNKLDPEILLARAASCVAVMRHVAAKNQKIRFHGIGRAVGLIGQDEPWEAWHRQQVADICQFCRSRRCACSRSRNARMVARGRRARESAQRRHPQQPACFYPFQP
jgi:hypothetical protein